LYFLSAGAVGCVILLRYTAHSTAALHNKTTYLSHLFYLLQSLSTGDLSQCGSVKIFLVAQNLGIIKDFLPFCCNALAAEAYNQ
jgi:hypothetical protein